MLRPRAIRVTIPSTLIRVSSMMLSRSAGVVRLGVYLDKVIGRCGSRGVLQMRSSRDCSRQDWEESE